MVGTKLFSKNFAIFMRGIRLSNHNKHCKSRIHSSVSSKIIKNIMYMYVCVYVSTILEMEILKVLQIENTKGRKEEIK